MLGPTQLEPFAGVERAVVALPAVRSPGMSVEQAIHLPPVGDAEIDLADI
ncbi:hypothetical protein FHS67_004958 [Aminobacter aminovorans]|uniref:Uncharacterized protein n=1 Tax=Aminobacter aminovorans TaxID=83263 RepID=A0ABR6HDK1_AMIAI|nr:hypothetical protein [Aminobacter aminovorans]